MIWLAGLRRRVKTPVSALPRHWLHTQCHKMRLSTATTPSYPKHQQQQPAPSPPPTPSPPSDQCCDPCLTLGEYRNWSPGIYAPTSSLTPTSQRNLRFQRWQGAMSCIASPALSAPALMLAKLAINLPRAWRKMKLLSGPSLPYNPPCIWLNHGLSGRKWLNEENAGICWGL